MKKNVTEHHKKTLFKVMDPNVHMLTESRRSTLNNSNNSDNEEFYERASEITG